jgi:hypothetical protein
MMSAQDELYSALKPEFEALASPLFEFAEEQVRRRGAFLPVGAALELGGRVRLVTAVSERDPATSDDVLPLLLEALEQVAAEQVIVAVAAADWVRISGAGQVEQPAVKVNVHHRRGLSVTFYVPAVRRLLGGWSFGEIIARCGDHMIGAWA